MDSIIAYNARERYRTVITDNEHQIIADEPIAVGGTNQGLSPSQLLASSLASCSAITIRMYADRKKWELDEIIISVSIVKQLATKTTKFRKQIDFTGNLTEEQTARLKEIANKCPVHVILSNSIEIESN
ncbi:OsmC family protein [Pseudopedobacter saltans DSM 12145]|uniref:OsmC family protein n=2 Tax=Pseudopedobacter saltans TaxID=151895 RepID=F0S7Y9_PSESL|nr:OsmC family protein [Pseudopedobacter saltans DSM 12145]